MATLIHKIYYLNLPLIAIRFSNKWVLAQDHQSLVPPFSHICKMWLINKSNHPLPKSSYHAPSVSPSAASLLWPPATALFFICLELFLLSLCCRMSYKIKWRTTSGSNSKRGGWATLREQRQKNAQMKLT